MQGNHGLWRSRSICLKLKSCLPILEFADLGVQITFCRQALPGRGDWLSRLCSRVFGGVDSRVAGTSWACTFASQSIPLSVCSFCPRLLSKMELLSASDSCRAICLCSDLPWKRRSGTSFCRRWRVRALYHSIRDVSSLSLLVWAALGSVIRGPRVRHEHQTSNTGRTLTEVIKDDMQQCDWTFQAASRAKSAQAAICKEKEELEALRSSGNISSRRLDHLQQKGTSSWLTATPVDDRDLVT